MNDSQQSHSSEQEQSIPPRAPTKQKESRPNTFKGKKIIKQIDLGNYEVLGQRTRSRFHHNHGENKIHAQQSDNLIQKNNFSKKNRPKSSITVKKCVEIQQQDKNEEKKSDSSDLKLGKAGNLAQKITLQDENKMELDQESNKIDEQQAQNQNGSLEKLRKNRKPFRKVKRTFWKDFQDEPIYTEQPCAFPFLNDYVQNYSQEYLKTMEAIDKIREGFQNPDKATFINCDVKYFNWQLFSEEIGKFDVLIIDPPWRIKGAQQNDSQFMFSNCRFSLEYSTMSNSQIQQLPLQLISDEGFIFLWILNTQLDSSLEIMQKWGYQLIDQLIWVKLREEKIYLTHGYYFMHSYQICLIGYKGKNPKTYKKYQQNLKVLGQKVYVEKMDQERPVQPQSDQMEKEVENLYASKVRPRANINGNTVFGAVNLKSQKPEDVYCLIEMMFKGHRKIQIFARNHNRRFGIFSIGNELGQSYQKWLQTSQCDQCSKVIQTGMKRFKSKQKANYDLCDECVNHVQKEKYFQIRNEVDQDIRHEYISCNYCKTEPIWGNRFFCETCHNFDLCEACYDKILQIQQSQKRNQIHPSDHKTGVLEVPHFGNDFAIHEFKCYSCYQNPIVGICYSCTSCKNFNLCQKCFFERPRGDSLFNNKTHRTDHEMEAIFQSQYRYDKKYECFSCKKSIQQNCWMCQNCHNFFFCEDCYNNKEKFKSLYANTHKKYHIYVKIF